MENQDFRSMFNEFIPEGEEEIDSLDLTTKKDDFPRAEQCLLEDQENKIEVSKTEHRFNIITFADWFSKYSNMVSSVDSVILKLSGVNPKESIVVVIPDDQGRRYEKNDMRHLRLIEYANIIPVIDAEPIDMFVYNNGYQILYSIGDGTYLKGYSSRKKFIVNVCKDVLDYIIPIGRFVVKRADTECKFNSYDLTSIIEQKIINNELDMEKLEILYHQSSKFDFSTFNELLKCITARQGGIKDIKHQLEIDYAVEKLCLDGVDYEA